MTIALRPIGSKATAALVIASLAGFVHAADDARLGNGHVQLEIRGPMPVDRAAITQWVETSAHAVSNYLGKFPVERVRLIVEPGEDGAVEGGMTFPNYVIHIHLGRETTPQDLNEDWMLTHEMFHLALPDLDEDYHYLEEGLSDYLEPIARARIGNISDKEAWGGFVVGMPQGQPHPGDGGLDGTKSWGRTYWGGCTFWLLADIRIRQATGNKKSLDDAIKAIQSAGGDIGHDWAIERIISVADAATGTHVLRDLHDEAGKKALTVDLDALWKQLGVSLKDGEISFDDKAPLAEIRKSITDK